MTFARSILIYTFISLLFSAVRSFLPKIKITTMPVDHVLLCTRALGGTTHVTGPILTDGTLADGMTHLLMGSIGIP